MELLRLKDSRKRYAALLGSKGDFMYDIESTLTLYEDEIDDDAFSLGQLESKTWLVDVMRDIFMVRNIDYGTIFVLCGWYGILPAMLFYGGIPVSKIRSFDIDPDCHKIADSMNKTNTDNQWRFKAITQDIFDINFEKHSWQCWSNKNERMSYPIIDSPDTIINTSCEHISPHWFNKIPKGKLVVLQSNDSFTEKNHINAVTSKEEFESMYSMSEVYYSGITEFEKYNRYMMIGVK